MSERISLLARPELPEIAPPDRIVLGPRSIAVVDALPGTPLVPSIASACTELGVAVCRARVRLRARPGHEALAPGDVVAHPDALRAAARDAIAGASADAPDGVVLVLDGAPLLAAVQPRLAVLGVASPSLAALDADIRVMRSRFDLVLYDFRPAALAELARTLAA